MIDNLSLQAQEEELKKIMKIIDNLQDGYEILKKIIYLRIKLIVKF